MLNPPLCSQTRGFTLIELIMVIVLLGVLSAVVIPRYADIAGSGRTSVIKAIEGSVRSAMVIVRRKAEIDGAALSAAAATVTLDGQSANLAFGYPTATAVTDTLIDASGIVFVAGITDPGEGDATEITEGDIIIARSSAVAITFTTGSCRFTYTEASSASVGAAITLQISTDGGATWSSATALANC